MDDDRKVCQDFANEHKLIFDDEGECGFGRECVGMSTGGAWVDYNPHDATTYERIEEFYDERLAPPHDQVPDAYHKHECMAVLGRGREAIRQLAIWCRHYNELGVEVVDRDRHDHGNIFSALLHGLTTKTIRVKK